MPNSTQLTLSSPAKLNLFLHITGRRPNGYHDLQTVFQMLDKGDTLTFTANQSGHVTLNCSLEELNTEDNLILKAANRLKALSDTEAGCHIELSKIIPMGGGLGGGSSNAASTLLALNHLWNLSLSTDELANIGLELGADIPVFVRGNTAFGEGVGENLTPVDTDPLWFAVLSPPCHISTVEIFCEPLLTRDTPKIKIAPALKAAGLLSYRNDCESIASSKYQPVKTALDYLATKGPARLTGTGACCFGWYESQAEAQKVVDQAPYPGFVAKGLARSPVLNELNIG